MSTVTNLRFKDKDETEVEGSMDIQIKAVSNGWILTATDDEEGEEFTEVFSFSNAAELLESIKTALNVPGA